MTQPYADYRGAGLQAYADRPRVDPLAKRDNESDEGHRRRIAPLIRHAETAVDEQAWLEHRAVADRSGLISGHTTAMERASSLTSPGASFAGEQQVEHLGHLAATNVPGSVSVPRLYASQIGDQQPPVLRTIPSGSSGDGWQ